MSEIVERVARAIYWAAYEPHEINGKFRHAIEPILPGETPSPGWCWEKASEIQRVFCIKQARAAIDEALK